MRIHLSICANILYVYGVSICDHQKISLKSAKMRSRKSSFEDEEDAEEKKRDRESGTGRMNEGEFECKIIEKERHGARINIISSDSRLTRPKMCG